MGRYIKLVGAEIKALIIIKLNSSRRTIRYIWKVLRMLVIILKEQMLYNLGAR